MRFKTYLTWFTIFLLGWTTLEAQITTTQYTGPAGGDWTTETNWNNGLPGPNNDALIGGGFSVVISSPLTVDFKITNYGDLVLDAALTNNGTIDNSGALTVSSSGSFDNLAVFNNFGTANFAGPATFKNEAGATFTNSGTFTLQTTLVNHGAITNNGTIDATNGTLQTQGSFNNNQTLTTRSLTVDAGSTFTNGFGSVLNLTVVGSNLLVDGNFDNYGTVNMDGIMTINGAFTNGSQLNNAAGSVITVNAGASLNSANGTIDNAGIIQNYGTLTNGYQLINKGEVNNFATFNNNNLIENQAGATFYNRSGATLGMGFGSKALNQGTFVNQGNINSFGTIENSGSFSNNGTLLSFSGSKITNSASFTNNGEISTNDQVVNDLNFTNNGTIHVNGGSVWTNNGVFLNSTTGTVNVVQDFNNSTSGTVTNNGRFINGVRTKNEGVFTNNAFLENKGNLTNATGGTLTNNELLLQSAGNLFNAGTLVNNNHVLSDDCSSLKNTGGIQNSGNLELLGISFQQGTITGNPLNVTGGYVHTAATSNAPAVCKNGTFGADVHGEVKVYAQELIAFTNFDSCSNIVYLANGLARPIFHCSDVGTMQTVHVVVKTHLGDSLTCDAQVMPVDMLEPQFNQCPGDIVIFTPENSVSATWIEPVFVDNCTPVNLTVSHSPGQSFPVGVTGVTYEARDSYGNLNSCQFRVDVRKTPAGAGCTGDNTAPTFTGCPSSINIQATGALTPASWIQPTPVDGCYPLTLSASHRPGQGFPAGSTTVTYTAKDGNGNSADCTFTVTVTANNPCLEDGQNPVINNCPGNIYLPLNTTINGAVAIWNSPSAADNCGVTSLTATHAPGAVFPAGVTTVTYTAKDAANHTATCSFNITVGNDPCPGDVTPPTVSGCPANISMLTTGVTAVASWAAPVATDPCAPVTVNNNYSSGTIFPLGVTNVTYQFADQKGNKATCSFTVTVQNACSVDNVAPVITGCPADIVVPAVSGSGVANWTAPAATDNCNLVVFTSSYLPGASFPIGTTTVVYTAIDLKGNSSNCSFNVSVVDAPGCTTNAAPIEGTTGVNPASVTLSWNSSSNASAYDVYLGTSNPPTTLAAANVSGTTVTLTGLNGGATYYWYVVPENNAGAATGCSSSLTQFSTTGTTGGGGGTGSGCNKEVLFVVGSTNLNSSDATVKSRLESLGYTVTVGDDYYCKTEDANGKGLVLISATVNSGYVGSKFRDVAVPVLCWESYLYDDMGMTGSSYGTQGYVYSTTIQTSNHPLAAGLSGTVNVLNSWSTISWGNPGQEAVRIASVPGNSSRSMIFAYEAGATMVGMAAPARRAGFFLYTNTGNYMTSNGLQLLDAAVIWAIGSQAPGASCNDGNPNTENDVIQADGCTCAGTEITACTVGLVCESNINDTGWNVHNDCTVTVCEGDKVILSVNPNGAQSSTMTGPNGYNATSSGGNDFLISNSVTAAMAGDYQVDLVDANGCTGSTTIKLVIQSAPAVTVSSTNSTCNQSNGAITFNFADNPAQTTLEFSLNGGSTYPYSVADNTGSYTVNNLAAGTYTLSVRWGNASCPKSLGQATIQNSGSGGPTAVCKNITLQLTAIGQSVQINGQQVDGGSTGGCGTILTYNVSPTSFSQPGTYPVTLTVTNNLGLSASCTATVTVLAPSTDCNPTAVCKNITLQLTAIGQSVQINGQQVDGGSTGGCGTILTYNVSPTSFSQPGTYTATLTVTTNLGLSASCTATVTVLAPGGGGGGSNCNTKALLVAGSTNLGSGDNWVKNRLEILGFQVTVKDDNYVSSSDANGMGLVLISSTVNSGSVGSKFTSVTVPVIVWESYVLDDMKMTGPTAGSDYGQNGNYNSLSITDSSHPLSAGLSGTVQVLTTSNSMRWGWTTASGVAKAAKIAGQSSRYGIFGFDTNVSMYGGFKAPARRVSLFLDDNTATSLTANGVKLFDAAVAWASGCSNLNLNDPAVGDRSSEAIQDPVEEKLFSENVKVYPNPAQDRIYVDMSGYAADQEVLVRLFDSRGAAIQVWNVISASEPVELELNPHNSGQYFLWMQAGKERPATLKVVLERF